MSASFSIMRDGLKILVLLLAFVTLAVGVFVWKTPATDAPADMPATAGAPATVPTPATVPGRDNVDHSVRAKTEALKRQVETAPRDTTALFRLAVLLQDAHQPEEAALYYERYLALQPANRQAWLDLANCYAEAGAWRRAHEATLRLLDRYPKDPSALYNMGAILANLSDAAGARSWWEQARAQTADPAIAAQAATALQQLDGGGR